MKDFENLKVDGHVGTFYKVEDFTRYGRKCYLMESCLYGDDAPWIAVYEDGTLCADTLHNGASDLIIYIEDDVQNYIDGKQLNQ